MTSSPAQLRYLADAVSTASPVQLLVMLYDRLVLDIRRAADAQDSGENIVATEHIRHAQQIIAELMSSLRTEAWEGADDLASLYTFTLQELISVNLNPDPSRLRKVETIVTGLRDSWRKAGIALLDQGKLDQAQPSNVGGDQAGNGASAPSGRSEPPGASGRPIAWVG
jgi:flagellar protein FliS